MTRKIGASDNNRTNRSKMTKKRKAFEVIIERIKKFDLYTEDHQHEILRIGVPGGFLRFAKAEEFRRKEIYFDLIYTGKRLRFAVEIAKSSKVGPVEIVNLYTGKKESYIIEDQLRLTAAEVRGLFDAVIKHFKPLYFQIITLEDGSLPPADYVAETNGIGVEK